MGAVIGIDLGTTFSVVASLDSTGRPVIIHNRDGSNITPSCVLFRSDGIVEVGEGARRVWGIDKSVAARFKRDMGTSMKFEAGGRSHTPTELSSLVLKKLVADTEASIGDVQEAVVTIPANFSHEAREATMAAAKAAGLNIRYVINEPTAAALYYAFKSGQELSGVYAVYDLGGGTFDVSIIQVRGQDIEVLATNGVAKLGGDDFDGALQRLVQQKYKALTGEILAPEDFTKNDAEEEKKSLSKRESITIRVNRKLIEVTRREFEESISALLAQAEMLCEATIDEAGVAFDDVKNIFLVGGSTRVPSVEQSVEKVFRRPPISSVNVDEVVALGAALYAAYKGDPSNLSRVQRNSIEKIKIQESTSKCFGTISFDRDHVRDRDVHRNSIIIPKGAKIPCSVTKSFYTVHQDQVQVSCTVTESSAPESDPRFVKVISEEVLQLPPGRPPEQEIRVTYSYDDNQIMKCAFLDVATGSLTQMDLSMTASSNASQSIEKYTVE